MLANNANATLDLPYATYFEVLAAGRLSRLSIWIGMGLLSVIAACLGFAKWHVPALLGTFALLGASIGVVPLVMKAIYLILFSWAQFVPSFLRRDSIAPGEYEGWVRQEYNLFSASAWPCRFGIAYALFAVAAFWRGGAFDRLPAFMLVIALAVALIASFVCGVGLAAIYYLGRFIWLLGRRYPVRIAEHGYGVLSTGRMLVKCYALVAVVWCLYTGSATWGMAGKWIPLLALAAPAVTFILGSFVAAQFPLHRRMVECKRAALLELDVLLERLTPQAPSDMSQERQRQIDFCVAEIKRVSRWPEWPFSFSNLSGVSAAALGAIAPQLIQVLLPILIKGKA